MRFSSSPGASPARLASFLISSLCLVSQTRAVSFPKAPEVHLDLSELGQVAFAGNFDSVSLYNFVGQDEDGLHTNGSQSLLGRYPSGAFATIISADAYIMSMCAFTNSDGTLNGVVVGGNFTSMGGQVAQAVGLYDPESGSLTPLPGLTGNVNAVWCDAERATVFVGGMFTGGDSTNAIAWVDGWTAMPFAGFNGPVNAISMLPNGNIVFAGAFDGVGSTQEPKIPDAQVVNIGSADITPTNPTTNPDYLNPRNIICKTPEQTGPGNSWLLADGSGGAWQADFGFGFNPTKLRLLNSKVEGYATKTWAFTFFPPDNGGIAEFEYFDADGNKQSCFNECPLAQNDTYQDFYFANVVGMSSFRIDIVEWYGTGGGLGGIELFQDDIFSFAIEDFNEPRCDGVSVGSNSTRIGDGWDTITADDVADPTAIMSSYLSAYLPGGTINPTDLSVVFMPDIKQSGNYSIKVFTPGCVPDGTCGLRGSVNITGQLSTDSSSPPLEATLYQTNDYDKYDQVYFGYVDATDESFKPAVTLAPVPAQNIPLTIVAQKVQFELLSPSSGGLNGLYEYDPDRLITPDEYSDSAIDSAGTDLDDGAQIIALQYNDGFTFAAGAFRSSAVSNIMAIPSDGPAKALAGGGLNNPVQTMYSDGTHLWIGGNFTNTRDNDATGLNNVAAYSIDDDSWMPLGAGVDGIVHAIIPIPVNITDSDTEDCISISGFFSHINAFDGNDAVEVVGLAIWVPSRNNWLANLDASTISVTGRMQSTTEIPGFPPLYAGTVDSQALDTSGVIGLSEDLTLKVLPVNIDQLATTSIPIAKREVIPQTNGASTGLYYNKNGLHLTIFGGSFTAEASDGSTVSNLVIINGTDSNGVTGLSQNSVSNGSILTLESHGTTLFAGGSLDGGLIMYDLTKGIMSSSQPPDLTGGNPTTVYSIASKPRSDSVFVAGSFDSAGSLPCPALCVYDTGSQQWSTPQGETLQTSSVINSIEWASQSRLILAGDIRVGGNRSSMASYDASKGRYHTFNGASEETVPGAVTAFSATESTYTSFFAAGVARGNNSAFLVHYDGGSTWTPITGFGPLTTIEDLQVMGLTESHDDNKFLEGDHTLMVMGLIQLPNVGNVSAALFDGKNFQPFVMTTTDDGQPGSVRKLVVQNPQNLLNESDEYLALGFIVLIGLAIALALIFLIVVIGVMAERIRRRREGYVPAPTFYDQGKLGIRAEKILGGVGKGPAAADTKPRL